MAHFKKPSKNKQINSNQKCERYAQTEVTFNELDIKILKERILLLEIENDKLKQENAQMKKLSKVPNNANDIKTLLSSSPLSQNFNGKLKGCSCKGNCNSKICGCMKRDLQCSESCKCNSSLCLNKFQGIYKENYGAVNLAPANQNKGRKTSNDSEFLSAKSKQKPTESVSSVDEVFYDASEPDSENKVIDLDAVRKLTFTTDEDTPEKNAIQLSAIQETNELSCQSTSEVEEPKTKNANKNANNNGKIRKNRKGSSSQVEKKQSVEDPKSSKSRKKPDSSKDSAANLKKQKKGSNSKRNASVEVETVDEINEELLKNAMINSRPRRNKGSSRSDDDNENLVKNQDPEKIVTKSTKDASESPNLKSVKTAGLESSRESLSNLKQPKDWKKLRSSVSVEKIKEAAEEETSKNTRSKRNSGNSFKGIVNKATRAISSEETSVESIQSRVRGLRRSTSSGAIIRETEKTIQKKATLQKSKSISTDNQTVSPGARTLNRSLSSGTLTKKPLQNLISKVSQSFRRSKSRDILEKPKNKSQLIETLNYTLTPVKESPKNLNETEASKEIMEKGLKFDPMQPTRQLSRSPIPAVSITESPQLDSFERRSPPLYGRYLNSLEMKIASPPPEILQDLCTEEVDQQTFQSKLAVCRKCYRKFFPHRIQLHEAVCQKV